MLTVPLRQEITDQGSWLFDELRFRVVFDDYMPESFGNSTVVLESEKMLVRFVRDRGQILCEVASLSDPDQWWSLPLVLKACVSQAPIPNFELSVVTGWLRDNYSVLVDCLGPKWPEMKLKLEELAVQREARFRRKQAPLT